MFYREVQRVEYYLCHDMNKDYWNDEGFEAVMKILLNRDSYYDSHLKPTAMGAGKRALEELVKEDGELSRVQEEAYKWLAENMNFLDEVYHRNFMDHY